MSRVIIYTKRDCRFSEQTRRFLEETGIPFDEVDVTDSAEARAEMIAAAGGAATTPQVFIDGEHIGGFDDLVEEDHRGRLAAIMASGLQAPLTDSN